MAKSKIKFFFFVGMCFLMYMLIFFPNNGDKYTFTQLLIDSVKSISISFVIVYVSEWIWGRIDSLMEKSK